MSQQAGVDADHTLVGQFGIVLTNAKRLMAVLVVNGAIKAPGQGDRLAVDNEARRLGDQRCDIDRLWLSPKETRADIAGDLTDSI